jgi:hypothetical protein
MAPAAVPLDHHALSRPASRAATTDCHDDAQSERRKTPISASLRLSGGWFATLGSRAPCHRGGRVRLRLSSMPSPALERRRIGGVEKPFSPIVRRHIFIQQLLCALRRYDPAWRRCPVRRALAAHSALRDPRRCRSSLADCPITFETKNGDKILGGPLPAKKKPSIWRAFLTRPERFELPTFGSVDRRSIQLSYGRSLLLASASS